MYGKQSETFKDTNLCLARALIKLNVTVDRPWRTFFNYVMLRGNSKKDGLPKYGISDFNTIEILQIWWEVTLILTLSLLITTFHLVFSTPFSYKSTIEQLFFIHHESLKTLKMSLIKWKIRPRSFLITSLINALVSSNFFFAFQGLIPALKSLKQKKQKK